MKSTATTVDAYLNELPEDRRAAMVTLRTLIRAIALDATESMQYGMAYYENGGEMYCALASQKNYMALYGCGAAAIEANRAAFGKLDCGKGCIRFRRLDELPMEVIAELLRGAATRGSVETGE